MAKTYKIQGDGSLMSKVEEDKEKEKKPSKSYDQLFNEGHELKEKVDVMERELDQLRGLQDSFNMALQDRNHFENMAAQLYDYLDTIQNQLGKIGDFKENVKGKMNNPPSRMAAIRAAQEAKKKQQQEEEGSNPETE